MGWFELGRVLVGSHFVVSRVDEDGNAGFVGELGWDEDGGSD